MSNDVERPIPVAADAEKAVICAAVGSEMAREKLLALPDDFLYLPATRDGRDILRQMDHAREPIAWETLQTRITATASPGLKEAFADWAASYPEGVAHLDFFVGELERSAGARQMIVTANKLENLAYSDSFSLSSAAEMVEPVMRLTASGSREPSDSGDLAGQVMQRVLERIDRRGELPGVASGLRALDAITGGFCRGELTLIGSRPSVGKSAALTSAAVNASRDGKGIVFYSLEMPSWQIGMRCVAALSCVPYVQMQRGTLTRDELERIRAAVEDMKRWRLTVRYAGGWTITKLGLDLAGRMRGSDPAAIAFVDYMQLVEPPESAAREQRHIALGAVSRCLKQLAVEHDIPIVAGAQLNRAAENRDEPSLAGLRESGSLEQDADVVLLLHRPHRSAKGRNPDEPEPAEILVAKNRHAPCGIVDVEIDNPCMIWRDRSDIEC